eukprot:7678265-Pyramimonas_sp.AAC.1
MVGTPVAGAAPRGAEPASGAAPPRQGGPTHPPPLRGVGDGGPRVALPRRHGRPRQGRAGHRGGRGAVSYTHLTLPTILLV